MTLEEKVKILEVYDEDQSVSSRGFPAKVKSRLNLDVGRSSLQRIIRDKEKILSIPEKYRKFWCRETSQIRHKFEKKLFEQFILVKQEKGFNFKTVHTLGMEILEGNEEFKSLRGKMKLSQNWFEKWKVTYFCKI